MMMCSLLLITLHTFVAEMHAHEPVGSDLDSLLDFRGKPAGRTAVTAIPGGTVPHYLPPLVPEPLMTPSPMWAGH